jgi:hypothetical protein
MAEVLMDFPEVSNIGNRIYFDGSMTHNQTAYNRSGGSERSYHEAHMPDRQHIKYACGCT